MVFSIYSTVIDPLLRDLRVHVPQFSGMKAGDRVLDVCCGTGDQVLHYARRGIIAAGIDHSPHMIRVAERNKRKHGLRNVSFQVGDATELPFRDHCFDYASISLALHEKEASPRNRIISEMKRVVRKEGILVFVDFQVPLPRNPYTCVAQAIEFIAGGEHHRYFKDYIGQGGLEEILRENQVSEEKRDYLKSGLVVIIEAKNP